MTDISYDFMNKEQLHRVYREVDAVVEKWVDDPPIVKLVALAFWMCALLPPDEAEGIVAWPRILSSTVIRPKSSQHTMPPEFAAFQDFKERDVRWLLVGEEVVCILTDGIAAHQDQLAREVSSLEKPLDALRHGGMDVHLLVLGLMHAALQVVTSKSLLYVILRTIPVDSAKQACMPRQEAVKKEMVN